MAKLLATFREPQWQRLEVVVMLALYAGLRQQEIVWLTREDVDLEDGWLHVRSKSAGHRSGRLPNAPSRLPQSWQITPTGLSPVDRTSLGAQWCRPNLGGETRCLFQAADVDDGGPHTLHRLRGTFATTVLRGGGDLESLRGVLGHSVLSVTAGYLAATSESKRRAVQGVRFPEPERAD